MARFDKDPGGSAGVRVPDGLFVTDEAFLHYGHPVKRSDVEDAVGRVLGRTGMMTASGEAVVGEVIDRLDEQIGVRKHGIPGVFMRTGAVSIIRGMVRDAMTRN